MENLSLDPDALMALAVTWGGKLLGGIATLFIGLYLVKLVVSLTRNVLNRSRVDPSLQGFLVSLVNILLKVMVYITAISVIGVEMTSFVAILGAAGLAVGMALSGTLQNFAGGVMILLFKPYKVGDVIEAQGYVGEVKEIQIFITVLSTPDNKSIMIPNGPLANGSMINYSAQSHRRVDWTFGIAYGDDLDKAYAVIDRRIAADDRIVKDPAPFRALAALADSSVNIVVRCWVKAPDYWGVFFAMNENIYKAFAAEGLSIPFPQQDVHVHMVK